MKAQPNQEALKQLLDMIVQSGLLEGLDMPKEEEGSEIEEALGIEEPEEEMEEEMDDIEELESMPEMSLTQLGSLPREFPKKKKGKKKKGR